MTRFLGKFGLVLMLISIGHSPKTAGIQELSVFIVFLIGMLLFLVEDSDEK